MSFRVAVVAETAPLFDSDDPAAKIRMPIVQSRVGNADDLPLALKFDPRLAGLFELENLPRHSIERAW